MSAAIGKSNRNTALLLVLLFIAVLIAILVAYNREKETTSGSDTIPHLPSPTNTTQDPNPPPPPQTNQTTVPSPPTAWVPDLVVALDGTGNYTLISDAIAAAPDKSIKRFVIHVRAGVYNENVKVTEDKTNLVLVGDGMNVTVLTSDRCASSGWSTSSSATLVVTGDGFMAQDMTIQNTAGPDGRQAVALRSGSEKSVYYRCNIIGYQDTLYAQNGRQFYRDCNIYGTVDFIFGRATSVFQNCNIYAQTPLPNQTITITAQGRDSTSMADGFSIHNCTITATPELESSRSMFHVYLGRPWKEYSMTVVMQSFLGDVIDREGWLAWNHSYESSLEYREFENRGPGSDTGKRVTWPGYRVIDNDVDARKYSVSEFIDGDLWLPAMNVPYVGGLL